MQDNINEKITALKNELKQIPIEDEAAREHINALIQEIENTSSNSSEKNNDIINNIKTSIDRFETEHPRATAILNDIMVTLSNIGI